MQIPDPIEKMEMMAERWADKYIKGNMFECFCGKMCKINDGQSIDDNPYAPPVCLDCFGVFLQEYKKHNNTKKKDKKWKKNGN